MFEEEQDIEYSYVLAQDPGETTGVALVRYTEHSAPELVYLDQVEGGREGFFNYFVSIDVGEATNTVSVSEKWVQREGVHGANLEPVYIEGVQYAIWVDQTVYQTPSVKAMVGDEFLKVQNLWVEGKRHAMDALLHAIYYLRSIEHKPTLDKLTGDDPNPIADPGEAEEKYRGDDKGEPGEGAGGSPEEEEEEEGAGAGDGGGDLTEEEGEPTGSGYFIHVEIPSEYTVPYVVGKRAKRTLNGAFMGFDDDAPE